MSCPSTSKGNHPNSLIEFDLNKFCVVPSPRFEALQLTCKTIASEFSLHTKSLYYHNTIVTFPMSIEYWKGREWEENRRRVETWIEKAPSAEKHGIRRVYISASRMRASQGPNWDSRPGYEWREDIVRGPMTIWNRFDATFVEMIAHLLLLCRKVQTEFVAVSRLDYVYDVGGVPASLCNLYPVLTSWESMKVLVLDGGFNINEGNYSAERSKKWRRRCNKKLVDINNQRQTKLKVWALGKLYHEKGLYSSGDQQPITGRYAYKVGDPLHPSIDGKMEYHDAGFGIEGPRLKDLKDSRRWFGPLSLDRSSSIPN